MTTEELLRDRYKVIDPYPCSPYKVGDIIVPGKNQTNVMASENYQYAFFMPVTELKKMPNIFQPLPWYAEREPGDMPPYIKRKRSDGTIEVLRVLDPSCDRREFGHEDGTIEHRFVFNDGFGGMPATLEEYNEWKQSKNK